MSPLEHISIPSVYDLDTIKKRNSRFAFLEFWIPGSADPGCYLLYTFQIQIEMKRIVLHENLIAFKEDQSATVLKFANFEFAQRKPSDLKENPEANEDL